MMMIYFCNYRDHETPSSAAIICFYASVMCGYDMRNGFGL